MKRRGLRSSSAGRDSAGKKWKWTTSKIVVFIIFGLLIIGIFFTEAFFSGSKQAPVESNNRVDPVADPSTNDPSMDRYFDSIIRSSGQTVVSRILRDSLQVEQTDVPQTTPTTNTPNRTNERPTPVRNTPVPRSQTSTSSGGGAAANNEPVASGNSSQLRLSDEGEIVEVQSNNNPRQNTTTNQNPEPEPDSAIEEQFYTPVTVTGIITASSDGTALSGVTIAVKGTAISTKTGFDGKYAIAVPGNPQYRTLQFSYRGNGAERTVYPDTKVINIRF